jgi:hypothetical protein
MRSWPLVVTIAAGWLRIRTPPLHEPFQMPTEDYPGPSKSHPEKEDKNDPPRPAGVDPVRPPMPEGQKPTPEKDEEEE